MNIEEYIADVNRPGKFEGEPPWTPYYYEQWANGDGEVVLGPEWDDRELTEFVVNANESEAFAPFDLPIGAYVLLWEDSQGFCITHVFDTKEEKEKFVSEFFGVEP